MLDSDISWQVLRRIVQEWAGTAAEIAEVRHLDGGGINNSLGIITNKNDRAVLKISPHRVNRDFEREAYQLRLMRELGLPVPRVYSAKTATLDEPDSYVLMEYMDGVDLANAREQCDAQQFERLQCDLAEVVARVHAQTGEAYARVTDPLGQAFSKWAEFFHSVYDPIWAEAQKDPLLPAKAKKQIGKIHEKLDRLLGHNDCPRLVHWDVWATNLLAAPDDNGDWRITALLDPNCKFAHAEAEIAYMELFHTCTPAFLKTYTQHHKLDQEYQRVRKPIYQLYDMIDHVALFSEQYVKPLMQTLERAAAVVG